MAVMTMWLLFSPTIHLACCLLLAVNYRKVYECFHIYRKNEKEFLNYYPMRYIILYEHPCHLPSTNCGKHDLPNNLSFKGLEIRAGWLHVVIKVLLTGSWVSMRVSQIRSMWEVWRAQRGVTVHLKQLYPLQCSWNFPSAPYFNIRFLWVMDALLRIAESTRTWGLSLLVLSACSMGIWCMLELFYLIRQLTFSLQVCSNGKLYSMGQHDKL